jgi:hypothetical protein
MEKEELQVLGKRRKLSKREKWLLSIDSIGINVPPVSERNVPPVSERNVPLVSD